MIVISRYVLGKGPGANEADAIDQAGSQLALPVVLFSFFPPLFSNRCWLLDRGDRSSLIGRLMLLGLFFSRVQHPRQARAFETDQSAVLGRVTAAAAL